MRTLLTVGLLVIAACAADGGDEDIGLGAAGGPSIAPSNVGVSAQAQTITFINSNNGVSLSSESSTKKAGIRCLAMVSGTSVNNAFNCGAEECVRGSAGAPVYNFKATACQTLATKWNGMWERKCGIMKTSVSPAQFLGYMFYTQGFDKVGYYGPNLGAAVGNCEIGAHKANWPPNISMPSMCTGTVLCGGPIPCPVPTAICLPSGSMFICPKC